MYEMDLYMNPILYAKSPEFLGENYIIAFCYAMGRFLILDESKNIMQIVDEENKDKVVAN